MKSLLSKTLMQFTLCSAVLFILATPIFYFLTKQFYAEDIIDIIEAIHNKRAIPKLDLERDILIGMTIQLMLIFSVLFLALMLMIRFLTKRLWLPFNDTLGKAERFNLAQSDVPMFQGTDITEFSRLNEVLNTLMSKDKETYRIQKEFTENASHELQTPLAVVRGKLDLLMQEKLSKRGMNLVADIYHINSSMEHLNRNLLMLAKIDNAQYTKMDKVNIYELILEMLPAYETLNGDNTIIFNGKKDVIHDANRILFESLLNNLVVNAIRHTEVKEDNITITQDSDTLTVSNPSHGKPLVKETIFKRFRTSGTAKDGNGLGLAIVKAICDFHGWAIEYKHIDDSHQFIITFK